MALIPGGERCPGNGVQCELMRIDIRPSTSSSALFRSPHLAGKEGQLLTRAGCSYLGLTASDHDRGSTARHKAGCGQRRTRGNLRVWLFCACGMKEQRVRAVVSLACPGFLQRCRRSFAFAVLTPCFPLVAQTTGSCIMVITKRCFLKGYPPDFFLFAFHSFSFSLFSTCLVDKPAITRNPGVEGDGM